MISAVIIILVHHHQPGTSYLPQSNTIVSSKNNMAMNMAFLDQQLSLGKSVIIIPGAGMQNDIVDENGCLRLSAAASSCCTQVTWIRQLMSRIIKYKTDDSPPRSRLLVVSLLITSIETEIIAEYQSEHRELLRTQWRNLYGSMFNHTTSPTGHIIPSSVVSFNIATYHFSPVRTAQGIAAFEQETKNDLFVKSKTYITFKFISQFFANAEEVYTVAIGVGFTKRNGMGLPNMFHLVGDEDLVKAKSYNIVRVSKDDMDLSIWGIPETSQLQPPSRHNVLCKSGQAFLLAQSCKNPNHLDMECSTRYQTKGDFVRFGRVCKKELLNAITNPGSATALENVALRYHNRVVFNVSIWNHGERGFPFDMNDSYTKKFWSQITRGGTGNNTKLTPLGGGPSPGVGSTEETANNVKLMLWGTPFPKGLDNAQQLATCLGKASQKYIQKQQRLKRKTSANREQERQQQKTQRTTKNSNLVAFFHTNCIKTLDPSRSDLQTSFNHVYRAMKLLKQRLSDDLGIHYCGSEKIAIPRYKAEMLEIVRGCVSVGGGMELPEVRKCFKGLELYTVGYIKRNLASLARNLNKK